MVRLDCLEKEKCIVTHFLLDMGGDMVRLDCLEKEKKCSVTHKLLVMGGDMVRLDCLEKEKMQCHSLPVGHGRRHGETRLPGKRKNAVSLTSCWSSWEETW